MCPTGAITFRFVCLESADETGRVPGCGLYREGKKRGDTDVNCEIWREGAHELNSGVLKMRNEK